VETRDQFAIERKGANVTENPVSGRAFSRKGFGFSP
jgi:hypothetical protein